MAVRDVARRYRIARADSPRLATLRAGLGRDRHHDDACLAAFWFEIERDGTPLIERLGGGGCAVTFLWRDADPDARLFVLANKLHDRSDPEGSLMDRLDDTDVWYLTYRLPSDWRGSYQIAVGAPAVDTSATDVAPGGRARVADGMGEAAADPRCILVLGAKSVAELPDAPDQPYRETLAGCPQGTVSQRRFADAPGGGATGWLYSPRIEPQGVLVVLDGDLWHGELGLVPALDRMIAERALPPLLVAMVAAVDRSAQLHGSIEFADWLAGPLLDELFAGRSIPRAAATTAIAGQSFGGLCALSSALRHPEHYGRVAAQSASLWSPAASLRPGPEHRHLRASLDVGSDEWTNIEPNQRFARGLADVADVRFVEYSGGHDRACWRGGLPDALIWLFRDEAE